MKKFFTKSLKKWFTLVEMMLVIAILGIFFAIVSQFDFSSRVNQEKATNFAHYIADIIRDARHDAMVGRMAKDGYHSSGRSNQAIIDGRVLEFVNWEAIVYWDDYDWKEEYIITWYFMKNNAYGGGNETQFMRSKGFFENNNDANYDILGIYYSMNSFNDNISLLENWVFNEYRYMRMICQNTWCEIRDTNNNPLSWVRTFKIVVEYKGFKRYIYGDILSGAIYVLNSESK